MDANSSVAPASTLEEPLKECLHLCTSALMQAYYQDLRALARSVMQRESPGQTLQPTALVHEVFLRLQDQARWSSPQHFYSTAATTMRRVLIDQARLKGRRMYRGKLPCENPNAFAECISDQAARELIEFDEALETLKRIDLIAGRVVELRVFAGISLSEAAEILETSTASVYREWCFAKAWLQCQLSSTD